MWGGVGCSWLILFKKTLYPEITLILCQERLMSLTYVSSAWRVWFSGLWNLSHSWWEGQEVRQTLESPTWVLEIRQHKRCIHMGSGSNAQNSQKILKKQVLGGTWRAAFREQRSIQSKNMGLDETRVWFGVSQLLRFTTYFTLQASELNMMKQHSGLSKQEEQQCAEILYSTWGFLILEQKEIDTNNLPWWFLLF